MAAMSACQAIDAIGWQPVGLFLVAHHPDDLLGAVLAYASLAPQLAMTALGGAWLATGHRRYVRALLGGLLAYVAASVLKRVLREPRPPNALRADFGMPSAHAAAALALALLLPLSTQLPLAVRRVLQLGAFAIAALVAVSRVYLRYHSSAQVAAGALLGAVVAVLLTASIKVAELADKANDDDDDNDPNDR